MRMNRLRILGVFVVFWGLTLILYSAAGLVGISLSRETAGIGAFPNFGTFFGVLVLAGGLVMVLMSFNGRWK